MSATLDKLMTADELEALPSMVDGQSYRYELIRGELKTTSLTKPLHGVVCMRVASPMNNFVEANDLGMVFGAETGFLIETDPDTLVGIDVAFVSNERLAQAESFEKFFPFAPDLAVEVLSPSNTVQEMEDKVASYFAAGSRAVWVFNPKRRTVAVYASPTDVRILTEADTLDGGDVLPGFQLSLAKLYAVIKR